MTKHERKCLLIARENLMYILRNGKSIKSWIAPISDEDKVRLIEECTKELKKEMQPTLFGKELV